MIHNILHQCIDSGHQKNVEKVTRLTPSRRYAGAVIPQRRVSSKKASQSSLRCFNSTMPHNTSSSLINNYLTPLNCSVCSHTSIQPQTQSATYTNLLKALHISHCIPPSFYEASINLLMVINLIPSIHL